MKRKNKRNLIVLLSMVLLAAFLASAVCGELHVNNCTDGYCLLCAAIGFAKQTAGFFAVAAIFGLLTLICKGALGNDAGSAPEGARRTLVELKEKLTS